MTTTEPMTMERADALGALRSAAGDAIEAARAVCDVWDRDGTRFEKRLPHAAAIAELQAAADFAAAEMTPVYFMRLENAAFAVRAVFGFAERYPGCAEGEALRALVFAVRSMTNAMFAAGANG